ncbi:Adenine deaminase [bacterium HR10]|nr:Adenine deaminase [bacterium HR10]
MRSWWPLTRMMVMSSLRSRVSLFFAFAFPLIFVFAFGYIFGGDDPARIRFVAAQLFTMIVIANGLFGLGNLLLMIRQKGVLRRLYTTPMSKHAVLSGVLAAWLLINSLTFVIVLGVFEAVFHAGIAHRAIALWVLFLLCASAIAGIAFVLASIVERPEGLAMGANALFFPMLFLSGLSIPMFFMPEWLQRIGRVMPSYAMLEFFRSLTENRPLGMMGMIYGIAIALVGIGGYMAAVAVYRWDPQQRLGKTQKVQLVTALALIFVIPRVGISLGQSVQQLRSWLTPRYIIAAGHVFDGDRVLPDSPIYIGIQDERIVFVSASVPDGWRSARIRDLRDAWVMPAMADLHAHLESPVIPVFDPTFSEEDRLRHDLIAGYVGSGITTVRSFGDDFKRLLELREIAEAGLRPYPRLLISGPILTAPGGHPLELPVFQWMSEEFRKRRVVEVADPDAARTALQALLREFRPDWIKIVYDAGDPTMFHTLPRLSRPTLQTLIQEAHRAGLRVAVHISKLEELRDAVLFGADMIEHIPLDAPIDDVTLAEMQRRGTIVCPTVFVIEGFRRQWGGMRIVDDFIRQRLLPPLRARLDRGGGFRRIEMIPEQYRPWIRDRMSAHVEQQLQTAYDNVKRLVNAGIPLVAGSDAGNPDVYHGPGLIHEVEALVRAGVTPLQALRAATAEAGHVVNMPIGRVRPGYVADLVILAQDPTTDVRRLRTLREVVYRGRFYAVEQLLR